MEQVFVEKDSPYTLRSGKYVLASKPKATGYDVENTGFLGARKWNAMPSSMKIPIHKRISKETLEATILVATVGYVDCMLIC